MAGVDAETFAVLDGFEHVQQSLAAIFSTRQGERPMREWLGNPGLKLLGENATEQTVILWFNILYMLVELFEPRFKVTRFIVEDITRDGFADFVVDGQYRPFAHLDWVQAQAFVSVTNGTITIRSA